MRAEMVTTLKRQATRILSELSQDSDPILITEQGKPAAYLVNVDDFEAMQKRMQLLESIARGERDLANQQTLSHSEVKTRMAKWLK